MLKRTYETTETECKFWVDKLTGNMHIDIDGAIGEIPHEEALKIVFELKDQLLCFHESKSDIWKKLFGK